MVEGVSFFWILTSYRLLSDKIFYKDKKLKGGKGFTVYSVSLDMNENAWKKAIQQDSLLWQYHVSELKGWGSEVVPKYAIAGIPTNYLINDKGIIIDKN